MTDAKERPMNVFSKHIPSRIDLKLDVYIPHQNFFYIFKNSFSDSFLHDSVQEVNFLLKFLTKFCKKWCKGEWDGFL